MDFEIGRSTGKSEILGKYSVIYLLSGDQGEFEKGRKKKQQHDAPIILRLVKN